jgi:predicted  nucleic acid-binding Zn-ribbon protein
MGNWKCLKCGQTTWSANKPLVTGCVKGGNHRWSAYNSNTPVNWRCSKCGCTTATSNRPVNSPCYRGGNHTWQKMH